MLPKLASLRTILVTFETYGSSPLKTKDGSKGYEIYVPDGRGAYFRSKGSFRGFIEDYLR